MRLSDGTYHSTVEVDGYPEVTAIALIAESCQDR